MEKRFIEWDFDNQSWKKTVENEAAVNIENL
jgi:hypothetical protein